MAFFVLEIVAFFYYANEESDEVTGGSINTKSKTLNQEYL